MQWPALMKAVQPFFHHLPVKRLGRNETRNLKRPMEKFTGLTPSTLLIQSVPLKIYCEMKVLNEEGLKSVDIWTVQAALEAMHKEIAEGKRRRRAWA